MIIRFSLFDVLYLIQMIQKKRVIIDIRDLNKITIIDFYFISLQTNIIVAVMNYQFIFVFDVADFFH